MDDDELPEEFMPFDISDVAVSYVISKDRKRVTSITKSDTPISEMRLYLILGNELTKLEKRLGIEPEDPENKH